jgi:hypothetical protein
MYQLESGVLHIVVPETKSIEAGFHALLQRRVNFALANTPAALSDEMVSVILESFYAGTTRDFDMLVSYCVGMVTPNKAVPYTDIFTTATAYYSEDTGWLDTSRVGHTCGCFSEYDSVLATAWQHPGQHYTCPGCMLNDAANKAISLALHVTNNFHNSVSDLYRYSDKPMTYYSVVKRIGDMFICNEDRKQGGGS